MKKTIGLVTIMLMLSVGVAACQKKEEVKTVKTERVLVKEEKLSLQSLDHRVTVLEEARARANAKAKKFSPAPKYDPNFKG